MRNTWAIVGIILIIVLLVLLLGSMGMMGFGGFGMGPGMMGGFGMHGFNGGFGFPFWGGLMMLVFWGLLIGGIVLVVVSLTRNSRGTSNVTLPPTRESPLDILKVRYARGEITKEQFDQMKKDLEG